MAGLVVTNGLQRSAVQTAQATSGSGPTYSASRHVQTMSVDDSTTALAAGHTAANSGGAVTTYFDKAISSATRTGQVVTFVMALAAGEGAMTIRRILLHDDTVANCSSSSTTLFGGVDALSLVKDTTFTLSISLDVTWSV